MKNLGFKPEISLIADMLVYDVVKRHE